MRLTFKSLAAAWALTLLAPSALWAQSALKLKVGVEGAYPPFSEAKAGGKVEGFDIDIANALCEQMKAQCSFVQLDFDALIPALTAKKIDAIIASMSITEERLKQIDFSDKYYHTPTRLVIKTGSAITPTPDGLKGKKLGVQRGTTHDKFVSVTFAQSDIQRYANQEDSFKDLAAGKLDAVLVDTVNASWGFFKTPAGKGFSFAGQVYLDPKFFGYGAGVGVRKADAELRAKFNEAIAAIRKDGTYKKINDKYFDFDIYGGAPIPIPRK
ncbi:MAG: ABC transporter substrate-binding protein [Betaproteobacteria bacterium]|nr:ABC transporter substrate-binding protein [Betaproteobacteria bacterium]